VAVGPAHAADRPFDPHHGNAQEQEGDEIGDHEGPAAVGRGLDRETKEVAQADGVAGHGQDEADARAPLLAAPRFNHDLRLLAEQHAGEAVDGQGQDETPTEDEEEPSVRGHALGHRTSSGFRAD
jgi:hypothetical protein